MTTKRKERAGFTGRPPARAGKDRASTGRILRVVGPLGAAPGAKGGHAEAGYQSSEFTES